MCNLSILLTESPLTIPHVIADIILFVSVTFHVVECNSSFNIPWENKCDTRVKLIPSLVD